MTPNVSPRLLCQSTLEMSTWMILMMKVTINLIFFYFYAEFYHFAESGSEITFIAQREIQFSLTNCVVKDYFVIVGSRYTKLSMKSDLCHNYFFTSVKLWRERLLEKSLRSGQLNLWLVVSGETQPMSCFLLTPSEEIRRTENTCLSHLMHT